MSIFGSIISKLFPASHPAVAATANGPVGAPAPAPGASLGATPPAAAAAPTTPVGPPVDIEQVLTAMAAKNSEKLNWSSSIVDLMKLLGLDSSLAARKSLATELHYSGNQDDSASMNVWLHKEVMRQVAANGGTVPASLKG